MELALKEKLLKATKLAEFQEILKKSDIKDVKELDEDILKHFCSLGNGDCSYNHGDLRRN